MGVWLRTVVSHARRDLPPPICKPKAGSPGAGQFFKLMESA